MCHRNQVEKGKDMDIIKKYKWHILPLAILVIVVAIVTMQPSKKTKEVKNKPTTVTKVSHSSHSSSKEKPSETSQTQEQPTQSEQAPSTQADGVTPSQDTLQQAQAQYGYGGIPADSPEVAREQGQNEARQQWHDDQVEWGIQQGYLNPDGSPKETN